MTGRYRDLFGLLASLVLACFAFAGASPASAQEDAGDEILWEVVNGEFEVNDLAVSGDSTIYLVGGDGAYVLRRDGPDAFVEVNERQIGHDTIFMASNGRLFFAARSLRMSTDYGRTSPVVVARGETIIETHSGALVAATDNLGVERSTDGGDTWTVIGRTDPVFQAVFGRFFAQSPPTPDLPHGRLVLVGLGGAAVSEDDGLSWQPSNLVTFFGFDAEHVVYSEALGAFFTLMNGPVDDGGSPNGVVRRSEDGQTWETVGRLPAGEFQFVGRLAAGADGSLWGVLTGGLDTSAFGGVHRSLDGGATWEEVGRFDGTDLVGNPLDVEDVVVDREGRVWVGFSQGEGGPLRRGAVLRTVEAVAASSEAGEPGKRGETVLGAVYPNPATNALRIDVAVETSTDLLVAVYDLLGRPVTEVYSGPLVGPRTFEIDTAGWTPGTYVVELQSTDGREATRVTIVR
ncbi:MAG: T9SS type A sorting domain-containing protein [Bacteroidota bacterium]